MRNSDDYSKRSLLRSCQDYLTTAKDVDTAKRNLKKSFTLLIFFLFFCWFILKDALLVEFFNNYILHGLVAFISVLLFLTMLFCFRRWTLKKSLKANKKQQLYLDYRIHLIKKNEIEVEIKGQMRVINIEQINDNFIKYLLTPLITQ